VDDIADVGAATVVAGTYEKRTGGGTVTETGGYVARLASGALDASFGSGGIVYRPGESQISALLVDAVGDHVLYCTATATTLLTGAGQLDVRYGSNGTIAIGSRSVGRPCSQFGFAASGALYYVDDAQPSYTSVTRLSPDGSIDRTYGQFGKTRLPIVAPVTAFATQAVGSTLPILRVLTDDSVVIARDGLDNRIQVTSLSTRITINGTIDPRWGGGPSGYLVRPDFSVADVHDSGGRLFFVGQDSLAAVAAVDAYRVQPEPLDVALRAVVPERLLETRTDGQRGYSGVKPGPGQTVELDVTTTGTVPADASAVVVNITGVDATGDGFVTVWPCGSERPTASNLNLVRGATSPNLVFTKIGADHKICLYTQTGAHLIADLVAWQPGATTSSTRPVSTVPFPLTNGS